MPLRVRLHQGHLVQTDGTGTVGSGLGGQTVGTPFAGSVGAGNSETRGSNVGQTTSGQH